eukprot:UN04131
MYKQKQNISLPLLFFSSTTTKVLPFFRSSHIDQSGQQGCEVIQYPVRIYSLIRCNLHSFALFTFYIIFSSLLSVHLFSFRTSARKGYTTLHNVLYDTHTHNTFFKIV